MSTLKVTNVLLAVIAACLVLIVARQPLGLLVPAAKAESGSQVQITGCYRQVEGRKEATDCNAILPIRVDSAGRLITTNSN
jgi:hypothetical protein